jgi:hypothetical protein
MPYGIDSELLGSPFVFPMKLEAVIISAGCSDFLAHTLPMNKPLFDKILVVTSPEDRDTQRICDYWNVPYERTDVLSTRWEGVFCKGKGINVGLDKLDKDGWVAHMDADIALPPHSRKALESADLDPAMIYGVDRLECKSWAAWQDFIGNPEPAIQGNGFFIHTTHSPFALGTRVAFQHHGGYIPIGFFQLWHPGESGISKYPEGHTDAGKEDANFPTQWPRRKRALIPEILAYHLESEAAPMAVNWKGRQTKPFRINS